MSSEDIGATGASGSASPPMPEILELPTDGTPGKVRNGSDVTIGGASENQIRRKMRFIRTPIKKKESTSGTTPERPQPEWNEEWNYSFDVELDFVDDLYKKDDDRSQSSKQGSKNRGQSSTDVKEPQTKSYWDDWDNAVQYIRHSIWS